ncbi:hypothetical protein ADIARSV_0172 [Arcticibacter svalbardensis MN12-7]|uniref:Uncharacterized protein n=1 Tax=Arcticibacter svalbardensis MN12-7 TaxID=1150600 RepID=R9GXW2_9SPHI|nr:hypothetical protein ADIARSV_0172 [Arcticibacter svalbardensis MN12-7]
MEDFVKENHLIIYRDELLNRENGVVMKDGISVQSLLCIGREANITYGENWRSLNCLES